MDNELQHVMESGQGVRGTRSGSVRAVYAAPS